RSYGIGRDALALLVTGVKAGASIKVAAMTAAAAIVLAGAITLRVVAASGARSVDVASAAAGGADRAEVAAGAAARGDESGDANHGGNEVARDEASLDASVRAFDPRLEWPDAEGLRRMERRGRALVFGVVTAPDGSPCDGATILFRGKE